MSRKECYEAKKALRRCVQCGNQDAYTINGRTLCADCTGLKNEYQKRDYEKTKVKRANRMALRYEKLKSEGKCPQCTRKIDDIRFSLCSICRGKRRTKYLLAQQENGGYLPYREDSTKCYFCGKKAITGKRTCKEHLERGIIYAEKMRLIKKEKKENETSCRPSLENV